MQKTKIKNNIMYVIWWW